jgi:hypothetical protein
LLRQHIASRNTDPCKSATAVGKLQHTPKHDFTSLINSFHTDGHCRLLHVLGRRAWHGFGLFYRLGATGRLLIEGQNTVTKKSIFGLAKLRASAGLHALALVGTGVLTTIALTSPVSAQDYNQVSATGKVQGTNGKAVVGATVEITSKDQGFKRTATTDGSGNFRVLALPQGVYSLPSRQKVMSRSPMAMLS